MKTPLKQAHEALQVVGLDPTFYERSPFELSGGEKRKVAIAGILAIHPQGLIVDEPTAGLDPRAAEETMAFFQKIHSEGTTIILVTHDMNLVLHYAEEVVVMENGEVAFHSAQPLSSLAKTFPIFAREPPIFIVSRGICRDLDLKSIPPSFTA
jgi:energy-coupling factor transporter ATP-binding protein EcfA2